MENNAKYMDNFVSKKRLLLSAIICMVKCEFRNVDTIVSKIN